MTSSVPANACMADHVTTLSSFHLLQEARLRCDPHVAMYLLSVMSVS